MSVTDDFANAIRFLSIDAVEKAQSGHPGMPLGMADIASVLWQHHLKHHPKNPHWFNRDRFVLSNGHGSMLLYSLLHLTGYALSMDDLKRFRQLHSKTPGHPEYGETPGVETTTGPLGQGLANAVGMAIAEKILASRYNRPSLELVNHHTYAFVGDGCLMEGISHEACSLAGTLGLGKLIVFYDDNGISIDGNVSSWFSDDTALRFQAYHWHVIGPINGHDTVAINRAIQDARDMQDKPSIILCQTTIGCGSPLAGSEQSHGAPLGAEAIAQTRQHFNWPYAPFEIPDAFYQTFDRSEQGQHEEDEWLHLCHAYQKTYPDEYKTFLRCINGDLPIDWDGFSAAFIERCRNESKPLATRKASQMCLETFAAHLPELLGGSADLTGSNNTNWSGTQAIQKGQFDGNYLNYGVREFAMAAIMNGLALHGGFIPYGGTFLVFADYARNAIRLSALMQQRVVYVFTHDSIGLGEDGPTHQPVEHAAMLRLTPNLNVWRPADLLETAIAWQQAIESRHTPSALLLSRQSLPQLTHAEQQHKDVAKGGYILKESLTPLDAILIATGSEVEIALKAADLALAKGLSVRVVSMPCCERFLEQSADYQEQVLPQSVRCRIAIEAAASGYWYRFTGLDGAVIGLDRFGVSAPAPEAYDALGITAAQVLHALGALLNKHP